MLRNRVKEIRRLKASEVAANPKNFRLHNDFQRQQFRAILGEVGYAGVSLAYHSERNGGRLTLIDGHMRGEETEPDFESDYAILSVNDAEADKLLLSYDWLSSLATIDEEKIKALSAEIETQTDAAKAMVEEISAQYIEDLTKPEAQEPSPDKAEELQKKWQTSVGQLWQVGRHRIICGGSDDKAVVDRLMQGERAVLCFTDPPYNVDYGNHGNCKWGKHRPIANDKLSAEEWDEFLDEWLAQTLSILDGAIYICMSAKEMPALRAAFVKAGGHWSSDIVWVKDRLVLGRKNYHSRYEGLLYGWVEGREHHWCGEFDRTDVWEIPRNSVNDLHPTMKPVELVERAILDASPNRGIVYDPFSGSGATLVACERTGRSGRAVELEPKYVAVALERLSEMGLEPRLIP